MLVELWFVDNVAGIDWIIEELGNLREFYSPFG